MRRRGWALLGLAAVTLFLFRSAVFGGRVLFRRDINMVWLPQVEVFVRCIASGSWPLWDRFTGFGRPLLADPRAEILYPPTWLNLVLPPGTYYTLFVVSHLVFSGLGLRALARRWQVSPAGAFVAGAVWIASGPLLSLAAMWHHLAGAAWIPWVFLAADRALESERSGPALLWGAAVAGQLLAGSPDYSAFTLVALAPYVLLRGMERPEPGGVLAAARVAGLALGFALALSAIQWIPTLEWALRSDREALTYAARTTWSLHPAALAEVLLPARWVNLPLLAEPKARILESKEPWLYSIYLGVGALALVAAGLARRWERRVYLASLGAGAVLFSLGSHAPAYDAITLLVPPLRMLRYPVKGMVLAAFAWSLLAGRGLDVWRGDGPSRRTWLSFVLAPTAALLLLSLGGSFAFGRAAGSWASALFERDAAGSFAWLAPAARAVGIGAASSACVLLLAWLRSARPRAGGATAAALAALALGQLLSFHADLHATAPRELLALRPEVLPLLERRELPRVYVYDYSLLKDAELRTNPEGRTAYRLARIPRGYTPDAALVLGAHLYLNPPTAARWGLSGSYDRDILGFDPRPLARLDALLREMEDTPAHLRLLRMGSVTHALALVPGAWWKDLRPVATVPELFAAPTHVFEVPDPLPRTYVVAGARIADGAGALAILAEPGFDPAREVVLPEGRPTPPGAGPQGSSRIVELRPDLVRIEADLAAPGYVVLVEGYDPGWRATVDGRGARVLRANLAFRAVATGAGKHVVEFTYRPPSVALGLLVSTLTLAGWLLWSVARRRQGLPKAEQG